jgi:hypothetical protein
MIPVKRLLAIHPPWTFRLAFDTSAWFQIVLVCYIEWPSRVVALGAPQVETLDLVLSEASLGNNSTHAH